MTMLSAAISLALTVSGGTIGFPPTCAEASHHWGLGTPRAIVISEDHPIPFSIVGWGTVISISPVDDPSTPFSDGLVVPGAIQDIVLTGDLVYAALDRAGVAIFRIDIEGPATLVPITRIPTPGRAIGLALGTDVLAVATGEAGICLFDNTNPARPVDIAVIAADEFVSDVAFDGLRLVAADRHALRIFDASNPSEPREMPAAPTTDSLTRIAVRGDYVYAGFAGSVPWGISTGGVAVFDLGDPDHPARIGHVQGGSAPAGIEIADDLVYVAYDQGLNTWHGALQILGLDDPRQPEVLLERSTGHPALAVATTGDLTLLGVRGVEVLDTTSPADPVVLRIASDDLLAAEGIALCGDVMVVADDSGHRLRLLSHDDGEPLTELGRITLEAGGPGLACSGDVVFAGAMEVTAVDISDPTSPRTLDTLRSIWKGNDDLALHGDVLYTGGKSYLIVDTSDPSNLVKLGDLDIPGYRGSLAMDGGHLFATYRNWDGKLRLRVLDVSDPLTPTVVSEIDLPPGFGPLYPADIAIADGLAVIVGTTIAAVDVKDPSTPTFLGLTDLPSGFGSARHVNLEGDVALVSHGSDITAIDLSDPASPAVIGRIRTPGIASATFWLDHGLLVADGPMGVTTFDITECRQRLIEPPTSMVVSD